MANHFHLSFCWIDGDDKDVSVIEFLFLNLKLEKDEIDLSVFRVTV